MRPRHSTGSTIGHSLKKLIDRGMPDVFVRLLVYWYRTQNACVRWSTACSEMFAVSNGVRQGGILSPLFFNVYMDGLSDILCRTECGCTMGGRMINHLMYADDLVLLSPSAKGLQRLVDIYYSKFAKDHYLGLHYMSRHGYHAKTKHGMYSRTCLFHECQCCIPNLNNR